MDKLLAILEEIRPEHDFSKSMDFITEGLLDSFDIVTLVSALEEHFGITIDGEDVTPENFNNLESLNGLLQKYLRSDNHG